MTLRMWCVQLRSRRACQCSWVKNLLGRLEHRSSERRRNGSHFIIYSKQKCQLKMKKPKTFKAENKTKEVEETIRVVEVEEKKKRKNNLTNKIGAKEDEVIESMLVEQLKC